MTKKELEQKLDAVITENKQLIADKSKLENHVLLLEEANTGLINENTNLSSSLQYEVKRVKQLSKEVDDLHEVRPLLLQLQALDQSVRLALTKFNFDYGRSRTDGSRIS